MYEYGKHIKPLQSSKHSIEKLIKHTVGLMEIKNSMGASKMTVVHLKKEQYCNYSITQYYIYTTDIKRKQEMMICVYVTADC